MAEYSGGSMQCSHGCAIAKKPTSATLCGKHSQSVLLAMS